MPAPTKSNPMENVFITQVGKLILRITKSEKSFDDDFTDLNKHLRKAQKMGWKRYEAEVVNALGILHAMHLREPLPYFEQALALAREANDDVLRLRLLNNLGTHHMLQRDFDTAKTYYEEAITVCATMTALPVPYLVIMGNLVQIALWQKRFEDAHTLGETALLSAGRVTLTNNRRTAYATGIWHVRSFLVLAQLALKLEDEAISNVKLIEELGQQLGYPAEHNQLYHALIALMFNNDETAYQAHIQKRLDADFTYPNMNNLECALYLKQVGYPYQALHLARLALSVYDTFDKTDPIAQFTQQLVTELEDAIADETIPSKPQ